MMDLTTPPIPSAAPPHGSSSSDHHRISSVESSGSTDTDIIPSCHWRARAEGENRRRSSGAASIEQVAASDGRSFRVRLAHTTTTTAAAAASSHVLSRPVSAGVAGVMERGGGHHQPMPGERDPLDDRHRDLLLQQQPLQQPKQDLHCASARNAHNVTVPSVGSAAEKRFLEFNCRLEEEAGRKARAQQEVGEREAQLRRNYEAKMTELEGALHESQRARNAVENALAQKEVEWQSARASLAQKSNDDAVAYVRRSLEMTLHAREKELEDTQALLRAERTRLAEALQREDDLRSRLLVAEETRVLYQLYLQRLLEVVRERAKEGPAPRCVTQPLVTNNDVAATLDEALRSVDAATAGGGEGTHGFAQDGIRRQEGQTQISAPRTALPPPSPSPPPRQLTNATLLISSMLEAKVAGCLSLWGREEKRRHDGLLSAFQASVGACMEETEAKLGVVLSSLRSMEQRVSDCSKTAASALQRCARASGGSSMRVEHLQQELKRVNYDYAQSQRQLQRAQVEISGLKEELARVDGEREVAMLMHRAAECLEDVRQSVRNAVRAAAHDMEQRTLEGNTLQEPFIQSIRVIAVKVEAHVEMARTALRREQQARGDGPIDTETMHRLILSPPRRSSRSRERDQQRVYQNDASGGSKNLLVLEELLRVMNNLCRLLENNARQMAGSTTKVTQTIADWESAIVKKMTDIWECMHGALVATASPPSAAGGTPRRALCAGPPLVLGDNYNDAGNRTPVQQQQTLCASSGAPAPKSSRMGSSSIASCSFAPSYSSSTDASRAASSAACAPTWRAALGDAGQVADTFFRRDVGPLSPPSIAVSRAPTPPPSQQQPTPSRTANTHLHHNQQQDLIAGSPHSSPSPVNGPLTVPRQPYRGESNGAERNGMRTVSGAILVRRKSTSY